ncbi:MAG: hypothetical protein QNJ65_12700 [Xenococcaceae cyanobacterium MO_234.B1]|nr:hypothetical protein [Xenococcaceae cyanobacterium MO_234.B1]
MTSSPQNNQELNPLGKLLSLVALLAAALYFTGWVYRWAYFGFFHVEVTALNLPVESFYLAAFRSLIGHPLTILRTIITLSITALVILVTLQLIQKLQRFIVRYLGRIPLNLTNTQLGSLNFLYSLINELVIVLWTLAALFLLAQWQADGDAFRDAVNETSRLPVVTTVIREENAALGRNLDNPLVNPSGFRLIGDRNLYDKLLGKELTDTSSPDQPRVWRLLIDREGYFYIFPALPKRESKQSVPVLIIYESGNGDQLTILSPEVAEN